MCPYWATEVHFSLKCFHVNCCHPNINFSNYSNNCDPCPNEIQTKEYSVQSNNSFRSNRCSHNETEVNSYLLITSLLIFFIHEGFRSTAIRENNCTISTLSVYINIHLNTSHSVKDVQTLPGADIDWPQLTGCQSLHQVEENYKIPKKQT